MSDGFWVALFALLAASLSSPLLVAWYQARRTREVALQAVLAAEILERKQTEVAAQAAEAAKLLAQKQTEIAAQAAEAAKLLLESNAEIAKEARVSQTQTVSRLDAIHTLVNSNMTAAMERELAATRAMLASMRDVIDVKEDRGIPVQPETRVVIAEVEKRITELVADLHYKKQQTDLAEAELKRRGQPPKPSEDPYSDQFGKGDVHGPSQSSDVQLEEKPND